MPELASQPLRLESVSHSLSSMPQRSVDPQFEWLIPSFYLPLARPEFMVRQAQIFAAFTLQLRALLEFAWDSPTRMVTGRNRNSKGYGARPFNISWTTFRGECTSTTSAAPREICYCEKQERQHESGSGRELSMVR